MSDLLHTFKSDPGQQRVNPAKIICLFLACNRRSSAFTSNDLFVLRAVGFGEVVDADDGGSCRFALVRSNRPIKIRQPGFAGAKERRVGHE